MNSLLLAFSALLCMSATAVTADCNLQVDTDNTIDYHFPCGLSIQAASDDRLLITSYENRQTWDLETDFPHLEREKANLKYVFSSRMLLWFIKDFVRASFPSPQFDKTIYIKDEDSIGAPIYVDLTRQFKKRLNFPPEVLVSDVTWSPDGRYAWLGGSIVHWKKEPDNSEANWAGVTYEGPLFYLFDASSGALIKAFADTLESEREVLSSSAWCTGSKSVYFNYSEFRGADTVLEDNLRRFDVSKEMTKQVYVGHNLGGTLISGSVASDSSLFLEGSALSYDREGGFETVGYKTFDPGTLTGCWIWQVPKDSLVSQSLTLSPNGRLVAYYLSNEFLLEETNKPGRSVLYQQSVQVESPNLLSVVFTNDSHRVYFVTESRHQALRVDDPKASEADVTVRCGTIQPRR